MLGQTVLARCLKTDTLKRCLHAAADWSVTNDPVLVDPTIAATGKKYHRIEKLLKEQTRWENVADRKEPITDNMVRDLHQLAKDKKIDSLENVIADWTTVGMCGGAFRLSEWAQDKSANSIKKTKRNLDGKPAAFVLPDFVFCDKKGRRLKQAKREMLQEKDVFIVSVCWRVQKNRNNGEIKKFARDDANPMFCAPRAALQI